ncbi:hypothetical protein AB0J38_32980 [Streptomyces sp. NPDC050095]|uniref:hypothetical protein n=1 Tax=unclassified Streptomyces TaxID=2593676 RepID=UPI00341DE9F3
MDVAAHWHAYEWVGHERPADSTRRDPSQPVPPLDIADWLRKPSRFVAETFHNPDDVPAASAWMRKGGEEHVAVTDESFSLDAQMRYVDDCLARGADVVWGYYSVNTRYVSRALVACPREGHRCPYGT